jgi:hypothetical protein
MGPIGPRASVMIRNEYCEYQAVWDERQDAGMNRVK